MGAFLAHLVRRVFEERALGRKHEEMRRIPETVWKNTTDQKTSL